MSAAGGKPRIAIIGGTGEFGRLFARIFREEGHMVVITGRDAAKGEKVAKSVGAEFTNDNISAAKEAEIVIISVPIEKTVEVIEEVAPNIRPGGLLMDFTSVKVRPAQAMLKSAPEDVDVIGTHPMFGPRVAGLEGQTVVITPLRGERWQGFVEGFFRGHRARVFVSTPEEHDRTMAVVQGLTHFAYITTASTIKRLDIDVDRSRMFASPVYELMLDFIARIVGQNPRLYAAIQMHNPYVEEVHRVFIDEAERLREAVSNGDVDGFVGIMAASARIFRDVDGSMGKSDKAISVLTSELQKLKSSVGKEAALRHIYSGKVHLGRVVSVDPEIVVLEAKGQKRRLKLSNIELLSAEEALKWKKEHLGVRQADFSYVFPDEVDEKRLAEIVKNLDSAVVSCEVMDVFKGKQIPAGKKSITLRVELLEPEKECLIGELLSGLGGKMR